MQGNPKQILLVTLFVLLAANCISGMQIKEKIQATQATGVPTVSIIGASYGNNDVTDMVQGIYAAA